MEAFFEYFEAIMAEITVLLDKILTAVLGPEYKGV